MKTRSLLATIVVCVLGTGLSSKVVAIHDQSFQQCQNVIDRYRSGVTPQTYSPLQRHSALYLYKKTDGRCGWGTGNNHSTAAAAQQLGFTKCKQNENAVLIPCTLVGVDGAILAAGITKFFEKPNSAPVAAVEQSSASVKPLSTREAGASSSGPLPNAQTTKQVTSENRQSNGAVQNTPSATSQQSGPASIEAQQTQFRVSPLSSRERRLIAIGTISTSEEMCSRFSQTVFSFTRTEYPRPYGYVLVWDKEKLAYKWFATRVQQYLAISNTRENMRDLQVDATTASIIEANLKKCLRQLAATDPERAAVVQHIFLRSSDSSTPCFAEKVRTESYLSETGEKRERTRIENTNVKCADLNLSAADNGSGIVFALMVSMREAAAALDAVLKDYENATSQSAQVARAEAAEAKKNAEADAAAKQKEKELLEQQQQKLASARARRDPKDVVAKVLNYASTAKDEGDDSDFWVRDENDKCTYLHIYTDSYSSVLLLYAEGLQQRPISINLNSIDPRTIKWQSFAKSGVTATTYEGRLMTWSSQELDFDRLQRGWSLVYGSYCSGLKRDF